MPAIASLTRIVVEVVLLIFQSTVVLFLATQLARKNALFATGFYKLFLSRCVVDFWVIVVVSYIKLKTSAPSESH